MFPLFIKFFNEYTSTGNALVKRGGLRCVDWEEEGDIMISIFLHLSLTLFPLSLHFVDLVETILTVWEFPSEFPLPLLCLSRLLSYLVETDSSLEIDIEIDMKIDMKTDMTWLTKIGSKPDLVASVGLANVLFEEALTTDGRDTIIRQRR